MPVVQLYSPLVVKTNSTSRHCQIRSDQISRWVVSDSLRLHESQHARPPCPSPTPGVHPDSHPSSQWCHPAISSSVVPFSSCPQSLPASGSFPMSQLFAWGGQSPGVSALASFLPKKSQGWSPSEWTGWISLQSKGLSRVFSNTTVQRHYFTNKSLYCQNYIFSSSHVRMWWELDVKKAEHWRTDAFELWYWRRLLRVPWTARSIQSILKEINPEYSLGGLMLKLKLQ